MDPNQLNHELQQLDRIASQSRQSIMSQSPHPLDHQHHSQAHEQHSSMYHLPPRMDLDLDLDLQTQQEQSSQGVQSEIPQLKQQHIDSTPQNVLAEARKNLQLLIDSGLSKEFLHQWVDNDLSHQYSVPCQQQQALPHSFASTTSPASSVTSSPMPSPSLTQSATSAHNHLQSPSHGHGALLSSSLQQSLPPPPPPPPPQVSTVPLPSVAHASPSASASGPSTATTSPIGPSSSTSMAPPATHVPSASSTGHAIIIKSEAFGEPRSWSASRAQASAPRVPSSHPASHSAHNGMLNHRPRMSISSMSSGSSTHGSVWSLNSARSNVSWASTGTASSRSSAPLPMTSPMTSSPAAPPVTNPQAAIVSKQNIYWCTSCETSFKRKYDWKRHEDEFHERWRKYPCPEPGCNRSFWGSNSFNQHHKQCHGCKTCPHAEKVVKQLRKRKYWACGFCSALHPARERHVEHVARHFESGLTKADWMHSRVIYGLLHQPLIHAAWEALVAAKYGSCSSRRPQFSWHPNKTGRAQGFLEKECPGQLQDRLEFFSGEERDVQWIVTMAFDLADIVITTPPSSSQPSAPPPAPLTVTSQQFMHGSMTPGAHFSQQLARGMPFPTAQLVSSQASQQGMLPSPISNSSSSFSSSPYQSQVFMTSPGFPALQQSAPESISQSPMVSSQRHLEKQGLAPIPDESDVAIVGSGMMDFDYSPAGVVFEGWEAVSNGNVLTAPQQHHQHVSSPDEAVPNQWGAPQCYDDSNTS